MVWLWQVLLLGLVRPSVNIQAAELLAPAPALEDSSSLPPLYQQHTGLHGHLVVPAWKGVEHRQRGAFLLSLSHPALSALVLSL